MLTDLGQDALPVENADLSDLLARQRVCLPPCPAVPAEHGDLAGWMTRPTPVRLVDLHRARAWPFVSWCLVDGHLSGDVELLVAKPGWLPLPGLRCRRHAADVAAVADTGQALGWSANWVRQVSRLALPVLCLAADKPLSTTATSHPSTGDPPWLRRDGRTVREVPHDVRVEARSSIVGAESPAIAMPVWSLPTMR